jgi:hypothetical protein
MQHLRNRAAAALHQALRGGGDGQPLLQQRGGQQGPHRANAHIVNARGVLGLWASVKAKCFFDFANIVDKI